MLPRLSSVPIDVLLVLLVMLVVEVGLPGADFCWGRGLRRVAFGLLVGSMVARSLAQASESPSRLSRAADLRKTTRSGTVQSMEWASVEMQGWRPTMEDATCVVGSLPAPLMQQALFAVFDGHGGPEVSRIASQSFPEVLAACARELCEAGGPAAAAGGSSAAALALRWLLGEEETADRPGAGAGKAEADSRSECVGKSLHLAMLRMDEDLRERGGGGSAACAACPSSGSRSPRRNDFYRTGSTALVVLVDLGEDAGGPRRLTVANCGDSRAVLCRGGRARDLSEDHKPELPAEEQRIKRAGGYVAPSGQTFRIDGRGLNLSRALGSFRYKSRPDLPPERQKVSCLPQITFLELEEADEFVVLGCDGIFDLNTSQGAVDLVRGSLREGRSVAEAAGLLVDRSCSPDVRASRGRGGDNCSAVVVKLR